MQGLWRLTLVEVGQVLEQQPELAPLHKAVVALVRRLVRAHQHGLLVELRPAHTSVRESKRE